MRPLSGGSQRQTGVTQSPPGTSPPQPPSSAALSQLRDEIEACTRCPRLLEHCRKIAAEKRRAYRDWQSWGKPVPGWGDPNAELLLLGLAPGAHGANRTGRMFTGDRSGDFLYRALWQAGFASQPNSEHVDDGLSLSNVWISASARCAPPDNKPSPEELRNCFPFLQTEFASLPNLKLVVALGGIAATTYLRLLREKGIVASLSAYPFGHGILHRFAGSPPLLCCYHPSQQNTSTGRLTAEMLHELFLQAGGFVTRARFAAPPGTPVSSS